MEQPKMTAPLNIVFYCSFRFYRDFFAGPTGKSHRQFWKKIFSPVITGYLISSDESSFVRCISTAEI